MVRSPGCRRRTRVDFGWSPRGRSVDWFERESGAVPLICESNHFSQRFATKLDDFDCWLPVSRKLSCEFPGVDAITNRPEFVDAIEIDRLAAEQSTHASKEANTP